MTMGMPTAMITGMNTRIFRLVLWFVDKSGRVRQNTRPLFFL